MRAVLQRVTNAAVLVGEKTVGSIERGLCVFIGIGRDDDSSDAEFIMRKILNLRIFEGENKKWDCSIRDLDLEVLVVSQFTLHGCLKGNKLDFHNSMNPTDALNFYNKFVEDLKRSYKPEKVQEGKFAAMMDVKITNDGPVTIILDSKSK